MFAGPRSPGPPSTSSSSALASSEYTSGPILIQLPPDLEVDMKALEATLDAFPAGLRLAVEPRHPSSLWTYHNPSRTAARRFVLPTAKAL